MLINFATKRLLYIGNKFKTILIDAGNELGIKGKDLFHPIRIALYGNPQGPDMPIIFSILGKDETLKRLSKFIKNHFSR